MNSAYRIHPNGGGMVAATASVANSVHVGSRCLVFGNARLSGSVRLTGYAAVGGTTIASAGVFAQNAFIVRGEYHLENKIITERQKE
jgi:UDP-3-O-[3-hydroxymyristoyl] glucosamine N-acyltransferase